MSSSTNHEKFTRLEYQIKEQKQQLKQIDLSNCHLTEFPLDLLYPLKDAIELINLGGNHLSSLPDEIIHFTKLRILFFANNQFQFIPKVLGQISTLYMLSFKANQLIEIDPDSLSPSIHWLILTDNRLTTLPASIGRLTHLRKLLLAGNELTSLPNEMSNCQELELIRLAVNKLTSLPAWLLNLPKLSWAAYSSNSFVNQNISSSCFLGNEISWNNLEIGQKLGEGASGEIYLAEWKKSDGVTESVAVKIFKNSINSDGSAEDEIQITERVGNHENFIGIHGRLSDNPDGKIGIVLPLLSAADYYILGKPPSFDSITRDVYDTNFSLPFVLNISRNVARACEHLHRQGIIHGDVYAHNVLTKVDGSSMLTDFGAATYLLDKFSPLEVVKILKIEVRAYGCLLDDLLTRIDITSVGENVETFSVLEQLRDECMHSLIESRPSFEDIRKRLDSLQV